MPWVREAPAANANKFEAGPVGKWRALVVLGMAQFLMVIDTSVMNVSISTLVRDFKTDVTTIQAVITLYSLVMAALMITGGKLGDLWGRRRAFMIGHAIYGCGSLITALAPTVVVLAFGWSLLEGIGAALVMPAMAALVAGSYTGRDRAVAYGVIGGIAGAAVAVGPIIGGWVTTYLTWRIVFGVEVLVVIGILLSTRWIPTPPAEATPPRLDLVGSALSIVGLAMIVLATLSSSTWGWISPKSGAPFTPFGLAPTLFVIGGGGAVLMLLRSWTLRREAHGRDPLVRSRLFKVEPLKAGLSTLLLQQLILMGVFFVIPLYLQIVLGLDAFRTGIKLLPVSVTLLLASMGGSRLSDKLSPRRIIRIGLGVLIVGILGLMGTIDPSLAGAGFSVSLGVLGVGIGLLASQLGNVIQSSVDDDDRSEAGGLQFTAQNLGASLGTALVGAVVIGALSTAFLFYVGNDARISAQVNDQVEVAVSRGVSFVPVSDVAAGLAKTPLTPEEQAALLQRYEQAQMKALTMGLLVVALLGVFAFWFTQNLPSEVLAARAKKDEAAASGDTAASAS